MPDLPDKLASAKEGKVLNVVALALARHALGLGSGRTMSYRNYFVCGETHRDYAEWMRMVVDGDAERYDRRSLFGGDWLFKLTLQGASAALRGEESLDPFDRFPVALQKGNDHE